MVKKIRKPLTSDQEARGVVFSSTLSKHRQETQGDVVHEVKEGQEDAAETRRRLLDDKFFNASPYRYNIVREGHSKKKVRRL